MRNAEGLALLHSTQMLRISVFYCSTYHLKFNLSFGVLIRLHFVVVLSFPGFNPSGNGVEPSGWFNGCYLGTSAWCPGALRMLGTRSAALRSFIQDGDQCELG